MNILPRLDKSPDYKTDRFDVRFDKYREDSNDMIAYDFNGDWHVVDPFVGCAWNYENAKDLIDRKATITGFWLNAGGRGMCFLVDEKGIKFID